MCEKHTKRFEKKNREGRGIPNTQSVRGKLIFKYTQTQHRFFIVALSLDRFTLKPKINLIIFIVFNISNSSIPTRSNE